MSKLIIIPDVHGRTFWKYPTVTYREAQFIFLGDYLDPYPEDHIKDADAFQRLQDIVAFKKNNPDRVILLWGNHDLHYLYDSIIKGSRYDEEHAERNMDFYKENQNLFQMAHEEMVCGRHYLFTHAGLCKDWAINYLPNGVKTTANWMNCNLLTAEHIKSLSAVSRWRGGPSYIDYGSIIWSDAHEKHYIQGITQVFGHTYMEDPMSDHYNDAYCLDCGRAFYLNTDDGNIYEMSSAPETQ